jgi:hypothetical protein
MNADFWVACKVAERYIPRKFIAYQNHIPWRNKSVTILFLIDNKGFTYS